MNPISLTTDFGSRDWFVGAMKGVIAGIHPGVTVIDLCHDLPPGDIRAGAFVLLAGYASFPVGTIHVAVVDPGVGSHRSALAIATERYVFVGPDNGVLSWAVAREKVLAIQRLDNPRFFRTPPSRTFHGRDVFAPVAAHLSRKVPIEDLGFPQADFIRLPWPAVTPLKAGFRGEVVYIDRFGNAVTNIPEPPESGPVAGFVALTRPPQERFPVVSHYQAVAPGAPLGIFGSAGYLELSINGGSAAAALQLEVGTPIALIIDGESGSR